MVETRTRQLDTDILIVGSGGAGLRAAIEATNAGVDVLVVSKGDFPSGCTTIAMGGMLAPFDDRDNADQHLTDTLEGGGYLNNEKLVRVLADRACDTARDLERYGTNFRKRDERYILFPYTGSTVPRGVIADAPYAGGYIRGLVKEVKRLGIRVLPRVMIAELLKQGDRVVGAVGLELGTDTVLSVRARAVIMATGGAGNIYHLTTNPPGITGDGYALAYRAGAMLQDMEMVQGRVCMISPEGMRGTPPPGDGLVTIGGRFYNSLCERYMKQYFPDKLEQVTRAQMSMCAQKEIQAGRHTPNRGVYGDLSGVDPEELLKFKRFMKACAEENFDPTWQPYEWAPGFHHFMGGVVINEQCETGIEGLYAAGEIAAGLHGANRLAGNALTETQVFGAVAGAVAAERVKAEGAWELPDTSARTEEVTGRLEEVRTRARGLDPLEVREEITGTMSVYVGVLRNGEGLRAAADTLSGIRSGKVGSICLGSDRSFETLAAALEVENLLIVGEMVVEGAAMRTETRGAHNREDYPETDEGWRKNIVFQFKDGERTVTTKDVNVSF